MDTVYQGIRVLVILLGCVAMWSLWVARRDRAYLWTSKLRKIWIVQFGWSLAAVEANIEFFYRHVRPSLAIVLVVGLLTLTIAGVFDSSKYTINET